MATRPAPIKEAVSCTAPKRKDKWTWDRWLKVIEILVIAGSIAVAPATHGSNWNGRT